MISLVVFDADGVVINKPRQFSEELERVFGIPQDVTRPFFQGVFQKCLVGQADLREELALHVAQWGWQGSLDELLEFWFSCEHHVDTSVLALVRVLRKQAKVVLATNQEKQRTAYMRKEMELDQEFDVIYSSADIGYLKNDERFFQYLLEKEHVVAEQVLLIDDSQENVASAQRLGIDACLFTNEAALRQVFAVHGFVT